MPRKKSRSQAYPSGHGTVDEVIDDLIRESQMEWSSADCLGQTALHLAAARGYSDLIPRICRRYPKMKEARNTFGDTPMMQAVSYGRKECVRALQQAGADIEAINNAGMRPIHHAAAEGQTACLSLLLEWGCRKDVPDKGGWTPLDWATNNDRRLCAQVLGGDGASPKPPENCPDQRLAPNFLQLSFRFFSSIHQERPTRSNYRLGKQSNSLGPRLEQLTFSF